MRARAVAAVALALTVALVVVGIGAAIARPAIATAVPAGLGLLGLVWAVLGMAIAGRGGGARVGVLMGVVAVNISLAATKEAAWAALAADPGLAAELAWLVAVLRESGSWLFVALALLLLAFPDGRLPSRRWRVVPPLLVVAALVRQVAGAFDPAPFPPPLDGLATPFPAASPLLELAGLVALPALLLGVLASAASVVTRFRRARGGQRAQVKWLALAGVGVPGFIVACVVEILVLGAPSWLSIGVAIATALALPIAIAIAMLRHELYDVDRAVSGAIAYAVVSAVVAVLFVALLAGAGVGLGRESTLTAAGVTAISALALAPARRWLQRRVDRRLYPRRQAAMEAIRSLERRTHSGQAEPEALEAELRTALRDPGLRVAFVPPGGNGLVDLTGAPMPAEGASPIVMGGTAIGAVIPASDSLSAGLVREVAQASGTLVEVVRLRMQLAATVRELEAGRARLVRVGDEERRRLERDLHDGAQQRLVSLGMSLRVAQRHLDDGSVDVDAMIDGTVAELGTAVAELRQIAHGLRPGRLDDGLGPALTALGRGLPVPVELEVTSVDMPDHVATTIYFVACEALANAVKHAGASHIGLRVASSEQGVELTVRDDGHGGAVVRHGSGLAGLRDRVAALGGTFAVESSGQGTLIHAVVPCAS